MIVEYGEGGVIEREDGGEVPLHHDEGLELPCIGLRCVMLTALGERLWSLFSERSFLLQRRQLLVLLKVFRGGGRSRSVLPKVAVTRATHILQRSRLADADEKKD